MPICRQDSHSQLSERPIEDTPVQSRTIRPPSAPFRLRPADFPVLPLLPQSQSSTIITEQPLPTIPSTWSGRSYTEAAPQLSHYHKPSQPANTSRPSQASAPPSSPVVHTQPTPSLTVPNAITSLKISASAATAPVTAPSTQPPLNNTSITNTAAMSSTATSFRGMPGAGSKEAPSFSGCARDLLKFFTQFEDLANSCGLTSREQCCAVLRYIDSAMKQLWISLPEYDTADYKAFKARVIDKYPGMEKGMQYTYSDLECIVLTHTDLDISTETELMEFSRQFHPVATWLVKNNKISERERDKLFWQGLPRHIRHTILLQLQLKDLKKFDHTEHPILKRLSELDMSFSLTISLMLTRMIR